MDMHCEHFTWQTFNQLKKQTCRRQNRSLGTFHICILRQKYQIFDSNSDSKGVIWGKL